MKVLLTAGVLAIVFSHVASQFIIKGKLYII